MKLRNAPRLFLAIVFVGATLAAGSDAGKPITVKGYVLDSACAFTKGLEKPISKECATACAKAGSPLVILTNDGTIYWPIAGTTPSSGQNRKTITVRRTESHCQRESLSTGRFERFGH